MCLLGWVLLVLIWTTSYRYLIDFFLHFLNYLFVYMFIYLLVNFVCLYFVVVVVVVVAFFLRDLLKVSPREFWVALLSCWYNLWCGYSQLFCDVLPKTASSFAFTVLFNPLTPKISSVILLTVCQTILIMLVWRIWYLINWYSHNWYFSLFSSLVCMILYR